MAQALEQAQRAADQHEVPVGAVLVKDDQLLAATHNRPIIDADTTAHAEILALRQAGQAVNNYRLPGSTLYVTLEPCCMCAGAIIHARIERLVFAAYDPKTGAAGSMFDVLIDTRHNHCVQVEGGLLATEAGDLLRSFFRKKRE